MTQIQQRPLCCALSPSQEEEKGGGQDGGKERQDKREGGEGLKMYTVGLLKLTSRRPVLLYEAHCRDRLARWVAVSPGTGHARHKVHVL